MFRVGTLLNVALHAQLYPFVERNLVAIVEEAKLAIESVAFERPSGLLDVAACRWIAITADRPTLAHGNTNCLQIGPHRRARKRRMQGTQTEGRVQLGILAAILVRQADRHPTTKTERLCRFFADGWPFLQLGQDGI